MKKDKPSVIEPWVPRIGVEVHVRLACETKLFCPCPSVVGAPPNTAVCEVCMGHPGSLPQLQGAPLEAAVRACVALGCEINGVTAFDRKHYDYPDLPKGYQLTQRGKPLALGGQVDFRCGGKTETWRLESAHLEEDVAKRVGETLDHNRSGTALLEIVTAPEERSPEEAEQMLRQLDWVLRASGALREELADGALRMDVNISLAPPGQWGTRVELKNLNSFRFVAAALREEIARQRACLEAGEAIEAHTRGREGTGTRRLRQKESEEGYGYMPAPDVAPVVIDTALLDKVRQHLGQVPLGLARITSQSAAVEQLQRVWGLSDDDGWALAGQEDVAAVLASLAMVKEATGQRWLLSEALRLVKGGPPAGPAHDLSPLLSAVASGAVSVGRAKELLSSWWQTGEIAVPSSSNLTEEALHETITGVFQDHADLVERYRQGQTKLLGPLMGELMKRVKGATDPSAARRALQERLR